MIAEISAGLSSLKAAKDIVQGLNALKTETSINETKIQLQSLILDAQQGLFSAQQEQVTVAKRIEELEQEILRLKDWTAEKQRYEAADTGKGSLAYKLKHGMENGEPSHWLCPTCFHNGKKSYLQPETLAVGRTEILRCHPCKTEIIVRGLRQTSHR
ncbi:hypothetical protein [Rhizorhapis sp. SPR117]|uniref:hypothetical protein n=1 Tax=Rhizorhapis sp. SPR117 TaxID=2912611 RepID=UPI001F42FD63|nr:hypothetical protein [Rhizorhapis sp. SPR117]